MNKIPILLLVLVLVMSGCVSVQDACIHDCQYMHADEYIEIRDDCIDKADSDYGTVGIELKCIADASHTVQAQCFSACRELLT